MQPDLIKKFEEKFCYKKDKSSWGTKIYLSDSLMATELKSFIVEAEAMGYARCEKNLREKIEGLEKEMNFELSPDMEFGRQRVVDCRLGYNEALNDVLSLFPKQ